jgi:hypothetical protein
MSAGAYDEEVRERVVRLTETETSWMFLTGDYAYKLRKPVNTGAADFSTISRRRMFLETELSLGRRVCPEVYFSVLPVNELSGRHRIMGPGKTVDYVLKMRQLPQDALLSNVISSGTAREADMDAIARKLSSFHKTAEVSREITEFGRIDNVMRYWEENFREAGQFVPDLLSADALERSRAAIAAFVSFRKELFERRVFEERIRRVHGDLHAGCVFMMSPEPCITGRVGYSMKLSCIDAVADAAALAEDMENRGLDGLSRHFTSRYVSYSGDRDAPRLLGFYKAHYAMTRGLAAARRIKRSEGTIEGRKATLEAMKHFEAAAGYIRGLA